MKVRCDICERTFKNQEGLEQHISAKHAGPQKVEIPSRTFKKSWIIGGIVLILFVLGGYALFSSVPNCKTSPPSEIDIGSHQNLALHIHADLEILIDGQKQLIPANIGTGKDFMRPLHTHDASGQIHIEGACARGFRLTEFFEVWGETLTNQCIFDTCTDSGILEMRVNGQPEQIDSYVMRDHDSIMITYTSQA
ncbi:hypothetical protein HYZ97_01960 [Candidatus Pacearchaeota archaeon]|nr:hypothetical protein [Candidatus Pacearchaeota archaeon]